MTKPTLKQIESLKHLRSGNKKSERLARIIEGNFQLSVEQQVELFEVSRQKSLQQNERRS